MAQTQTLTLFHEIESLVSDNLQVVSYKWLSRNYMISSDEAKRLLQEFVEKHDSGGVEVVYALSGWLKSSHPSYHVKLVTSPKLAEAQQEFDGNCSVHVYSVQASIPKDPAMLWNAEFIQSEELSKQPFSVDNCLRDNRFCGISSSFVCRNVDGRTVISAAPHTKPAVSMESTKNNIVYQPPKNVTHDSIPGVLKPQNVMKDAKSESNSTGSAGVHNDINKPTEDNEKVLLLPTGKRKAQADKSSSATGGSLASLWGRASAKPKPCSPPAENSNTTSNPTVATDGAKTHTSEAVEDDSGDDDNHIGVSVRRSTNRRRVVFDFSDEDEDAVNLASPEPIKQSPLDSRQNDKKSEKAILKFDKQIESKSKVKEEKESDQKANQPWREDLSVISKCTSTRKSCTEKVESRAPEILVNKDSQNNTAPSSPKRRKVMKTRIDERGREVTEVVWEGEETESKKDDKSTTKKSDNNATNAVNSAPSSAPATKKSANTTTNPTGKGGSKKGGKAKDPKQGNILSFFKKV